MMIGGIGRGGEGGIDKNPSVSSSSSMKIQTVTNNKSSVIQTTDRVARQVITVTALNNTVQVENAVNDPIKSARAPMRSGMSTQALMHMVSTIGSKLEDAIKNDLEEICSSATDIQDKINGLIESLIEDHSKTSQNFSGKSLSFVEQVRLKNEIKAHHVGKIRDLLSAVLAFESIKVEGDISHLEASNIHSVYELCGGRHAKVQKKEIAEESYKYLGLAVGQRELTADPEKIAALLESKGCGKTLGVETKSRIVENVCKELVLLAAKSSKTEKEKKEGGALKTEGGTPLDKEPTPVKSASSTGEFIAKKEDAHREAARVTERLIEKNAAAKQLDQHMKKENEKRLDAKIEEKKTREVKNLKER